MIGAFSQMAKNYGNGYRGKYSRKEKPVIFHNDAEREAAAIAKMKEYEVERPAGRFQTNNPPNKASYYAKPSAEEMQESLANCLDDFDRMIKAEKNRLK
jgi:hypothetical protein